MTPFLARNTLFVILLIAFLPACREDYTPKPRGYERIEFPAKAYKPFTSECGFTFDIPVYSNIYPDLHPAAEKCWMNLFYEPFNATLHLSYKTIKDRRMLYKLIEDSRTLVYKHTVKADEIYETLIGNEYLNGMVYELSGNTATNFEFYVTDSTEHWLRGSLYFNVKTNVDSIEPSLNFLKQDIMQMLESLRWK